MTHRLTRTSTATVVFLAISLAIALTGAARGEDAAERAKHATEMQQGNFKDAYEGLRKLALDPADDPLKVGEDLRNAVQCLNRLNRTNEIDEFFEKVVDVHKANWRLLRDAARLLNAETNHYGFLIAGKFVRGNHRGGGKYVNAIGRDRGRALQLMTQALDKIKNETSKNEVGRFYMEFAACWHSNANGFGAWTLQALTDVNQLPDYDEPYVNRYGYGYGGGETGAPVTSDGDPVYYKIPGTFETAANDGERWRWCLMQASESSPDLAREARYEFAAFLRSQFDVQTAAEYASFFGEAMDDTKQDHANPYALSTLGEEDTIARLATGIKRFKLPDEFNFIKILQQNANERGAFGENSLHLLAQIFTDRQQYDKAVDYLKRILQFYGDPNHGVQAQIDQILGNWGMFEQTQEFAPGKVSLDYRFRNGTSVKCDARAVNVKQLLDDVKAYINTKPGNNLDWNRINIQDIGYRFVQNNDAKYLGESVGAWGVELKPREKHFDRRVAIKTPLEKPGAYMVTARMDGGNVSRILVWVDDTVIVEKKLDNANYYFVADAVTGQPVPGAKFEFFGYQQLWQANNKMEIKTAEFSETADAEGQVFSKATPDRQNFQWLITASTADGRFAYTGFSNIWYQNYYDYEYNQTKVFAITDRPVYRPSQTVKFKFWVGQAKYDQEGKSPYAGRQFNVEVHNPKDEKIFSKGFVADEFGGLDGELTLGKEADLGSYGIFITNMGGGSFRVEEYKKPEFEVKVDAPTDPVMLGEKITAGLSAKYFFGAPVTDAKVSYKIFRYTHHADWYPQGRWDWLFAPGYWWFAPDYNWYPGFYEWGVRRPFFSWMGQRWGEQPELISQNETVIGADGTLKIEIDTALAKAAHGNTDHRYEIRAEVTDASRRVITGTGNVMVARKPFKVYTWLDRGHYKVGDDIEADVKAQTLDNKPVQGKGELKLLKVSYADPKAGETAAPDEKEVQKWSLDTDAQGVARQQMKASEPGQYRLSYTVTDKAGHAIEGGYVFCISGNGFDGSKFRFNDVELLTDKREYKPGDSVQLMVNANRADTTVLLFVRSSNGVGLPPKVIHMKGKSDVEAIEIIKKDMPNFFVEALTVADCRVHTEMREIIVPPESRVLNVEVLPSAQQYKPGEKAPVTIKLTEANGEPFAGSAVLTVYDKSVEYISGGSNVPEIKKFFWDWRRNNYPQFTTSLARRSYHLAAPKEPQMGFLGVFGNMLLDDSDVAGTGKPGALRERGGKGGGYGGGVQHMARAKAMTADEGGMEQQLGQNAAPAAPMAAAAMDAVEEKSAGANRRADSADKAKDAAGEPEAQGGGDVEPTVRSNFADTAFWTGALNVGANGIATAEVTMPESLTTWKFKVWSMGAGTRVGQGEAEAVTTKNLLIRLQAPRFFTQKDEVVISANVHNYLATKKKVKVSLGLDGPCLQPPLIGQAVSNSKPTDGPVQPDTEREVEIDSKGEARIDWRVKVIAAGQAVVRVKAITDEESDAMQMTFPAYVHGMEKMDSFSGAIRPEKDSAALAFTVPEERRPEDSRVEIRYSPTLAGAMVDAIPYLVDYPYGCTEQTLSRFLPAVITQKVLMRMNLDLKDIKAKITNLNAQEIGDDQKRAAQWGGVGMAGRGDHPFAINPVFDDEELHNRVKASVARLSSLQLTDGGWGWFGGWGEHSSPHETAYVVHGLQIAKGNGVEIDPNMLTRGQMWLKTYQDQQLMMLRNAATQTIPYKMKADNLDAMVCMVLTDAQQPNKEMIDRLYNDRNDISVYGKAMLGLVLHKQKDAERLAMIVKNIDQYLVQDDENQTAYLKLPDSDAWWYWYGGEYEAQGYYLKLLAATDPKSEKASRLVKYLINNRKHATYWNSTRDTAVCIEAMAEYITSSGEDAPDMKVQVLVDGKVAKEVAINASNLFSFDNKVVLTGAAISSGKHTLEFKKTGKGPLYFNAYVTNFTLEDHIGKAGLEIKVERKYYKLTPVDKTVKAEGAHGQALDQKVEKYERKELQDLATLKSGDLLEVELEIDSKNDYEYILFEDMKPAGFEPVDVRSGYVQTGLPAYMELRDERVCLFCRSLPRGKNSISYRTRAEIPGSFNALPTKASAMYAPELRGNSDEIKLKIED